MVLDNPGQTFTAEGGTGRIGASIAAGCQWTAESDSAWVHITSGSSGNGSGTVTYGVDANGTTEARGATIRVGTERVQISQQPAAPAVCTYAIDVERRVVPARATGFAVRVTAPFGCRWTFTGNGTWLNVVPDSDGAPNGNGNGTVVVEASENSGSAARTSTATVAGHAVTVLQDGTVEPACRYQVSPTSLEFEAPGGAGTFEVTTDAACGWTTALGGPDLSVVASITPAESVGSGPVHYVASANMGTGPRKGSVVVLGRTGAGSARHDVLQKAP
jgi:hypothetical protein